MPNQIKNGLVAVNNIWKRIVAFKNALSIFSTDPFNSWSYHSKYDYSSTNKDNTNQENIIFPWSKQERLVILICIGNKLTQHIDWSAYENNLTNKKDRVDQAKNSKWNIIEMYNRPILTKQ